MDNQKMALAYAIGKLHGMAECKDHHPMYKLGKIWQDWEGYTLMAHDHASGSENNTMALYYNGQFGKERGFTRLLCLDEGWDFNHAVHLITQAIDCHKKELAEKK